MPEGKLKVYSDDEVHAKIQADGLDAGRSKTAGCGASTTPTAGRRR